jgi:acetyl-CoA C-acetyltransferase
VQAQDEGRFDDEIVPMEVVRKDGTTTVFDKDEHPRRDTSADRLAGLRVLHPEIDGFSITAGNSSGINDAAAAVMVVSAKFAQEQGLTPLAVIRGWSSVGVDPIETGLAPSLAIPKALRRSGLELGDVKLFEINEAFAAMCVATTNALGIDEGIVNISGSGISLGHPIAATGARMVTTLIGDLRRAGGGLGVASMCAGGGMGSALVLEVL